MNNIPREILENASHGDLDAFEHVYKAASGFVYNVAMGITQNSFDAEEVTQDVFIKIYDNLKNFNFKSSFKTWAYRITVNTAINKYKVSARTKERYMSIDNEDEIASVETHPGKNIEEEENRARVKFLLSFLSPELRSCLVLRELENLEYKEIAETLKIPINTVRSRLKRAREALVALVGKKEVEHAM